MHAGNDVWMQVKSESVVVGGSGPPITCLCNWAFRDTDFSCSTGITS